ncbi:hypothetical protein UCRPC4_g02029 [Phaeomoniella chlamydospora]|uniref:Restriction of telomere capping protein 4 n=1 Tax=Phaeomoniella chlamydospora TaxID=158046 RepID=A0A0G2ESE2_PHACM|nr:hypothetical protein UCRPC4_g02029 [Phaeomoniella chlamydospora]
MGSSSSATSLHSKQDGAIKVPGERTTGNADGQVGGSAFKMPRGLLEGSGSSQEEHTFVIRNPISPQPVRPVANRGVRQRASEIADTSLRIEVQQAMDVAGEFKIRDDPLGQISNPSSSPVDAFQDDTFSRITQGPARSSSLSSVPSDSPLDEFNRSTEFIPCPLCETPLHRDFFESYNNGRPLKFSEQHRFCHDHKLNTAKAQWKEKGYPDVQWANWIPSRVDNSHIQTLLEILYSKQPSHYEAILADRASGGVKALQMYLKREIIDVVHPGYYGPKGNKHLTQMIQERLAKQLNRSAKKNPLVRDAGVGGYVQAVLVPELTVLLVKEDMSIETDERAREIIKESSEMGRLIHGEEEDVIHADDSD